MPHFIGIRTSRSPARALGSPRHNPYARIPSRRCPRVRDQLLLDPLVKEGEIFLPFVQQRRENVGCPSRDQPLLPTCRSCPVLLLASRLGLPVRFVMRPNVPSEELADLRQIERVC